MTIAEKYRQMTSHAPPPGTSPERKFFERFDELDEQQRKHAFEQIVNVPFVVVAMILSEAKALLDGTVQDRNNAARNSRFHEMLAALTQPPREQAEQEQAEQEQARRAWLDHYQQTREDWIPNIYQEGPALSIAALIEQAVIKRFADRTVNVTFWPDIQETATGFFAPDPDVQNQAWERLQNGYVVLLDGISLFHPYIRHTLHQAQLDHNKVALLMFSPLQDVVWNLDRLIERELQLEMQRTFGRFARSFDPFCECGVNHDRSVQRWLFNSVAQLARRMQKEPHPDNRWGSGTRNIYRDAVATGGRQ